MNNPIAPKINMCNRCAEALREGIDGHEWSCKNGGPPHSMVLPVTDNIVELEKTPASGTGPDRLLKDRFR